MGRKLYEFVSILLVIMILFSSTVTADAKNSGHKRVIADHVDKDSIKNFESKGCTLRHKIKDGASFDCPEAAVSQLNAREARIFRIVDINADMQTGADKVWNEGVDGTGSVVFVMDTGIDYNHPDLNSRYIGGYDFVNNDDDPMDDHGHGTHVAGIIASSGLNDAGTKGVSPGAKIYMYKVCDGAGNCFEDDMLAAMNASVIAGAKIMSISIGGGGTTGDNCDTDPLAAMVNWAASQGVTVVVAAGNDGATVSSPGCASGAVSTGAVNNLDDVAYFSGRGKALDIVAPGVDIYSTLMGGSAGLMSGTSMATPHVAGVVALLLSANPALTVDDIKSALYTTADPVNRCYKCTFIGRTCYLTQVTCTTDMTGAGVVDAYGAYLKVKPVINDSDGDGVADASDACPTTYGKDCNGCPNLCTGCAAMTCPADGAPVCAAGTCAATACPANGCGVGTCAQNQTGTFTALPNTCEVVGNAGTCTNNQCTLTCADSQSCTQTKCYSAGNLYKTSTQARKFCKCATPTHTYGYKSYTTSSGRKTVNKYVDASNNMNWALTTSSASSSITAVKCSNGVTYSTGKDYYY